MKISFLVPSLSSGGAERTVVYLSAFFFDKGHEVEIINISGDIFYELDKSVKYTSLNISSNSKNVVERIVNIAKRLVSLNSHLNKVKPDAVVCLLPETAKYVLSLHKRRKFALITSERNNPELDGNNELKQKIFMQSDGIVFQTIRAKNWYSDSIQKKSIVIHNAVGNDFVYQVPEISERKNKISAIGRLANQKDYPTLFKAFKKITEKHSNYSLEIFGNGPEEDKLKCLAAELGISEKVKFMGIHKDAILQIADSACYVMSSVYEGMPNALMEAMAVGLPCVSTDCPNGPAELIISGENGLLVPVGDSDVLASAILRMIDDKPFAEACGKNARKILDTHSVELIAKQYMDYIESVVEQR